MNAVWLALGFLLALGVYLVLGAVFLVWADQFVERDKTDDRLAAWLIPTWPLWLVVIVALMIWHRRWPQPRIEEAPPRGNEAGPGMGDRPRA